MATVQYGPLIAQARGKVGAIYFSRNRAGDFVAAKPVWEQPNTDPQLAARYAHQQLIQEWQLTLTDAQRALWRQYDRQFPRPARFGNPQPPNGYAAFYRVNMPWMRYVGGLLTETPPTEGPLPIPTWEVTYTPPEDYMLFTWLNWNGRGNPANFAAYVALGPQTSTAVNSNTSHFTAWYADALDTDPSTPHLLYCPVPPYTPPCRQWWAVRLQDLDTFSVSPLSYPYADMPT